MPTRTGPAEELLLDPDVLDDPNDFYRRLRDESPVWCLASSSIVVVSSFAAVTEATNRVEDFSSNIRSLVYRGESGTPEVIPFGGTGDNIDVLATADPPTHSAHRSTVFPELVARRMADLRTDVESLVDERIAGALDRGSFDFMEEVGNAVPIRVVSRLIGFEDEDPESLLAAAFDSTAILAATAPLDATLGAMARTAEIYTWIGHQLDRAVAEGAEGVLGVIACAVADGRMDRADGLVIMHTLLSAGGESTTSLLGNAIYVLATDRRLQARVRAEPDLITPFIEEVLRLESPFRHHLRHVPRTTELHGVPIPADSTMLLFWGAANRDPAEYERPDDVVLDRKTPKHHLAFGRGIHHCVGAPLARLEADVVLRHMLEATKHFSLDPDRRAVRVNSLMVRRFESLPIVLAPGA